MTEQGSRTNVVGELTATQLHRAICLSGWVGRGQMDVWHRGPEGEWPCHDILVRLDAELRNGSGR